MDYLESLKWRYATKKFDPDKIIDPDTVDRILEAAGLTATSLGLQAIKILKIEDPTIREALLPHCYYQKQVVDASDLLVICVDTHMDPHRIDSFTQLVAKTRNQNVSELEGFKKMITNFVDGFKSHEPMQEWLIRQAYITMGTLLTACALEKVDSCPMEGFKPKEIAKVLQLEEKELLPVLLLPIGYRSEEDHHQHLPKVRKPIDEFVQNI